MAINTKTTISFRTERACLLGFQAVVLMVVGTQLIQREMIGARQFDVVHYHSIANDLMLGKVPYRDFLLEYPPFSIVALLLPRLAVLGRSDLGPYLWAMLLQSVLMSTGIGIIVIRMTDRWRFPFASREALAVYVVLVALGCVLLPWRYDVFPALLTALALQTLFSGRPLRSGIWLGLGIAAKVYPGALVPVFACYLSVQKASEDLVRFIAGCVGAISASLIPFLIISPASLLVPVRYHQSRGFEIESVVAGFALIARSFRLLPAEVVSNYGAVHLDASWLEPFLRAVPTLVAGVIALFSLRCHFVMKREFILSGSISPAIVARCSAAAILLFIAANKVFSPQYVFWLLPFAPLLKPRPAKAIALIFLLTALIYPFTFRALEGMAPGAIMLLNLRNLLVLATLANLLSEADEKNSGRVVMLP